MILLGFIRYQMMIPIEMGGQKGELIGTVRQIDGKKVILKNIQIQGLENLPKIGQKIKVTGKICDFQKATNFGQFDVRSYYQSRQIYGYMKVKNYGIKKSFPTDFRPEELMRENGLSVEQIVEDIKSVCREHVM